MNSMLFSVGLYYCTKQFSFYFNNIIIIVKYEKPHNRSAHRYQYIIMITG